MERQIEELLPRYLKRESGLMWELIQREVKRLETAREQARAELTVSETAVLAWESATAELSSLAKYIDRVRRNLAQLDFEGKRLALGALNVTVFAASNDPDQWRFTWGVPVDSVGDENTIS